MTVCHIGCALFQGPARWVPVRCVKVKQFWLFCSNAVIPFINCSEQNRGGCLIYNTGLFGHDWSAFVGSPHVRYSREEAERVYRGQDVQVHTVSHFALNTLPDPQITAEVNLDAENIRAMFGHTPVGLSWPGGDRDWVPVFSNIFHAIFAASFSSLLSRISHPLT